MSYDNEVLKENVKKITEESKTVEELKEKLKVFFHYINEENGKIVCKRKHCKETFLCLIISYKETNEIITEITYSYEITEIKNI